MAKRSKKRPPQPQRLSVGDRVYFDLAGHRITGIIVEDRGNLGVGGRQLFAIKAKMGLETESIFELPAEELKAAKTAA